MSSVAVLISSIDQRLDVGLARGHRGQLIRLFELEHEQTPVADAAYRREEPGKVDDAGADTLVIDPVGRGHVGNVEVDEVLADLGDKGVEHIVESRASLGGVAAACGNAYLSR